MKIKMFNQEWEMTPEHWKEPEQFVSDNEGNFQYYFEQHIEGTAISPQDPDAYHDFIYSDDLDLVNIMSQLSIPYLEDLL